MRAKPPGLPSSILARPGTGAELTACDSLTEWSARAIVH